MKKESIIRKIKAKIKKCQSYIDSGLLGREGRLYNDAKIEAYEEDLELVEKLKD